MNLLSLTDMVCPTGWGLLERSGMCYHADASATVTLTEAEYLCGTSLDARLFSPLTTEEFQFGTSRLWVGDKIWTDITDQDEEGNLLKNKTTTGQNLRHYFS